MFGSVKTHSCPSFHVAIRWHDCIRGGVVTLKPYIPPVSNLETLLERFRPGSVIFFLFYAFQKEPMYLRALGPTLDLHTVRQMQRHTLSSNEKLSQSCPYKIIMETCQSI